MKMPVRSLRLIKNSKRVSCKECGEIHEFISRRGEGKQCGIPVAYGIAVANHLSRILAFGTQDVVPVPYRMTVTMDDSARRLPHQREEQSPLGRRSLIDRMA